MNLAVPLTSPQVNGTAGPSSLTAEAFFGDRFSKPSTMDPVTDTIFEEQPGHIILARFLAFGMSQKDAGKAASYSPAQVAKLLKMPWFQERVAQFLAEGAKGDLLTLFKGAALGAFATLQELVDNPKTPPAVRLAGVKEILERNLGKTTQVVEVKAGTADPVAEVESLEREVSNLRNQLKLDPDPQGLEGAS